MPYKIIISSQAKSDLKKLTDYIRYHFGAPMTAHRKYLLIRSAIDTLAEHPFWQRAYAGNPWRELDLFIYNVDSYRIIHAPNEAKSQTIILRILHQSQDLSKQLENTKSNPLQ